MFQQKKNHFKTPLKSKFDSMYVQQAGSLVKNMNMFQNIEFK